MDSAWIHVLMATGEILLHGNARNATAIQVAIQFERHVLHVSDPAPQVVSLVQQILIILVLIKRVSQPALLATMPLDPPIQIIYVCNAIKIILLLHLMAPASLVMDLTPITAYLVVVSSIWIQQLENV